MLRNNIKAIVFDLDNTLYKNPPDKNNIFAEAHAKAALHLGVKMDFSKALATARQSYHDHQSEMFLFCRDHGVQEKDLYHHTHKIGVHLMAQFLYPDIQIKNAFNKLAQNYELVLLTHGSAIWAESLMQHLELLADMSSGHILSLDHPVVNFQKKDQGPGVFNDVANMLSLGCEHIAMIEDTVANLEHAASVGMQTILVHWGKPLAPKPNYVDLQVQSVAELVF